MIDTRQLLTKISDFRSRLDAMPKLLPEAPKPSLLTIERPPESELERRVRAGSRTQELLQDSLRSLMPSFTAEPTIPKQLTARARRLMTEAREHLHHLRGLADHPLLQGPPPDSTSPPGATDITVIYFHETMAILESAVRMGSALPELPSAQLRLCEGLEGILNSVRDRLVTLHQLISQRREDVELLDTLSLMLTRIESGESVAITNLIQLADRILSENLGGPLRLLHVDPRETQLYLGGATYPAPTRFVAAHSLSVARVLARLIQGDADWHDNLREPILAALIHDVGMLRVSVKTLNETEPLDEAARREIESHPHVGAELLERSIPEIIPLLSVVARHHERVDGTGYPNGATREKIPALARLLAVADAYTALCSDRPHRVALDPRTALTDTLMMAEQGKLDRVQSQKLLKLSFYPVGSVVELNDGSIGVVISNHAGRFQLTTALRPVVALLTNQTGQLLPTPEYVDLSEASQSSVLRALMRSERLALLGRHYPLWAMG